jgi:DnaJ like chaperone protein
MPSPRLSDSAIVPPQMSIWTRVIDVLTGVGGSVLEFLTSMARPGRNPPDPETSIAFTIGMIALGAKMAKADGVVSRREVDAFKEVFEIAPDDLPHVARVFNLAKQDVAGFDSYARQIGRLFARRPQVLEDVLDGLFHIAKADGGIHVGELDYLSAVAGHFGFDERRFARIRARHIQFAKNDPYVILGVDPGATDEQLKKQYRKLVRENHPDRHIAAGLPRELIALATQKLAAINDAYAQIARARSL